MGWGLPGILRYLPGPTIVPRRAVERTLELLPSDGRFLDVGSGGRRITQGVVAVDAVSAPSGGRHSRYPQITDQRWIDCIVCTGTLEHVRDPRQAVSEFCRVLKPGGFVHIDVPFIQGYHADPTDFWRSPLDGRRLLCGRFEELAAGVHIGPICGLVRVAREWANSCTANRYLPNLLPITVATLTAPLRYLDYLVIRSPRSHRVASALFFRGRKPLANSRAS